MVNNSIKKEDLFREIATLYKGITVAEYQKKFGGMSAECIARRLRLAKAIYMQTGVLY